MERLENRIFSPRLPSLMRGLAIAGVACLGLSGCTTGNERPYVGNDQPNNMYKAAIMVDSGEPAPVYSDAPSVIGLSRAHWQQTVVSVPVDGLASKPTFASKHLMTNTTARQRGQYPTDMTALELDGDTGWTQVGETVLSPFSAAWDGTRMIFYDLWAAPVWEEGVYPLRPPYDRGGYTSMRQPQAPPSDSSDPAGASR